MAAPRNKKHILVIREPRTEAYTPHGLAIRATPIASPADRPAHGAQLAASLQNAIALAAERRLTAQVPIDGVTPSLYVEFRSPEGVLLELSALEAVRSGIEVVAVRREGASEIATVVIPEGRVGHFLRRFELYSNPAPKEKGERRHENMVDRIADLRLATLKAFWTDTGTDYPPETEERWWELWLRKTDGAEHARLADFCNQTNVTLSPRRLEFDDRIVVLVRASARQLALSIDVLNDIAELRATHQPAGFFVDQTAAGQVEWVNELLGRTQLPPENAPAVCILDTGINRGHPLLSASLSQADMHVCNPTWAANDDDGHGTEMAGLALYGNLSVPCSDTAPVLLRHRLESVRILPPVGHAPNPPELYAAVTASATSLPEIVAPQRSRCFSLCVGASADPERGQPTSWSAAIDALAAGRSFDAHRQGLFYIDDEGGARRERLFLISAGNVDVGTFSVDHLTQSDIALIEDPAQAWNALSVGAFTSLNATADPDWTGWVAVADAGELSPWSRTSVSFDAPWPNKPDVVFEGGNILHDGAGEFDFPIPDLCVLSTDRNPQQRSFRLSWATSAACAQVAQIAGHISAEYPDLWPQTVRALVVHSAEWTDTMKKHLIGQRGRQARSTLVRRYGFGVPRLGHALRSAADALTLIVQGTIKPYEQGKMREIQLHQLPWPKEQLAALGAVGVRLRVTLSYFIEPNPSRVGWRKKHRYQSYALRFSVKGSTESLADFRKRLNEEALDGEESRPDSPQDAGWFLGARIRDRGSLHADIWNGSAADLAEREVIAVYPIGGWWKDQPKRDRSDRGVRYSLVVSIESPEQEVDIWTAVAQQVGIPNEVVIEGG
ncbi:MAG: S8 family peptidase [Gammaproteobacteria bacterium]